MDIDSFWEYTDPALSEERFRAALALDPAYLPAHSGLLACLNYLPRLTPAEILAEHRRFAERFEAPLARERRPLSNRPDPDRRLRVGRVGRLLQRLKRLLRQSRSRPRQLSRFDALCGGVLQRRQIEILGQLGSLLSRARGLIGLLHARVTFLRATSISQPGRAPASLAEMKRNHAAYAESLKAV